MKKLTQCLILAAGALALAGCDDIFNDESYSTQGSGYHHHRGSYVAGSYSGQSSGSPVYGSSSQGYQVGSAPSTSSSSGSSVSGSYSSGSAPAARASTPASSGGYESGSSASGSSNVSGSYSSSSDANDAKPKAGAGTPAESSSASGYETGSE